MAHTQARFTELEDRKTLKSGITLRRDLLTIGMRKGPALPLVLSMVALAEALTSIIPDIGAWRMIPLTPIADMLQTHDQTRPLK